MSGLDDLTRDELILQLLKLYEIVQIQAGQIEQQAQRIAELEAIVARQAERIAYLEEELSKHGGDSKPHWVKANKATKEPGERKAAAVKEKVLVTSYE